VRRYAAVAPASQASAARSRSSWSHAWSASTAVRSSPRRLAR